MKKSIGDQCEALSRKTNQRCPHRGVVIFPNVIGHHPALDANQYTIYGEEVCLCRGHYQAFSPKKEPLRLIKQCFLKASNKYGYGTRVSDRGGSVEGDLAHNFKRWGPIRFRGNVPEHLRKILSIQEEGRDHEGNA